MTDTHTIRVFIADDQDMITQGLRYIIQSQPDMTVVGVANNGREAEHALRQGGIDVALLDIRMPFASGIEIARRCQGTDWQGKIVLLTTFDQPDYILDGIRAGAVGFLLKDAPTEQLLEGIRRAAAGEVFFSSANAQHAFSAVNTFIAGESHTLAEPLTTRELEVLQHMANGLRNHDIATRMCVSIGTVKTHVHRILSKMGAEDRTQAVVWAIRSHLVD